MFLLGQRPRRNPLRVAVWPLSTTTTEAINRAPQRVATGATAALTATDHSTAYPGGGASKKNMAVASPILPPTRSANFHNRVKRPKVQRIAQDFDDSCIAVSLFRAWRFWAPSAHPREAGSDSFLACAAKTKQACGGAHATMHAVALICNRGCQPGVA